MFLAWNEIKRNKLKFGLIIGILVLISYLLFLLSGLANGLINMNTEGIKSGKHAIILNKDANQTVQQSIFETSKSNDKFKETSSLKQMGVIASNGDSEENALLFGIKADSFLMPKIVKGKNLLKTMKSLLIRHSKIKDLK